MRIIREETIGVKDVKHTADSFGGGADAEEMFVDVEDEDLLNVNEKQPGAAGKVSDIEVIPERKKITKRQLRKIIKEEKQKLMKESTALALSDLYAAIEGLIRALGNEGAHTELSGIVEDWDNSFATLGEME